MRAALSRPVQGQIPDWAIERWLDDALAATFVGEDPALALTKTQAKADAYLACLASAAADDAERRDVCAWATDAEYKTFEELSQENLP